MEQQKNLSVLLLAQPPSWFTSGWEAFLPCRCVSSYTVGKFPWMFGNWVQVMGISFLAYCYFHPCKLCCFVLWLLILSSRLQLIHTQWSCFHVLRFVSLARDLWIAFFIHVHCSPRSQILMKYTGSSFCPASKLGQYGQMEPVVFFLLGVWI